MASLRQSAIAGCSAGPVKRFARPIAGTMKRRKRGAGRPRLASQLGRKSSSVSRYAHTPPSTSAPARGETRSSGFGSTAAPAARCKSATAPAAPRVCPTAAGTKLVRPRAPDVSCASSSGSSGMRPRRQRASVAGGNVRNNPTGSVGPSVAMRARDGARVSVQRKASTALESSDVLIDSVVSPDLRAAVADSTADASDSSLPIVTPRGFRAKRVLVLTSGRREGAVRTKRRGAICMACLLRSISN
eukprot:208306-Prymnesium_polylepis.3